MICNKETKAEFGTTTAAAVDDLASVLVATSRTEALRYDVSLTDFGVETPTADGAVAGARGLPIVIPVPNADRARMLLDPCQPRLAWDDDDEGEEDVEDDEDEDEDDFFPDDADDFEEEEEEDDDEDEDDELD